MKLSGVSGWKGMTAEGTIKYASGSEYPAHVAVLGMDRYRLDVDRAEGKQSTVLSGTTGVFLPASGKSVMVSSDINALGLLAFRVFSSQYPNAKSIWTDQGSTTVGGKVLYRVTLDDPATDATGNSWKTEELFFDPGTGRLVMSTAVVHLNSSDRALYMLTTSYDDYRTVNGIPLPYSYTQSLNGQPSWTLSLATIDPQAIPAPALLTTRKRSFHVPCSCAAFRAAVNALVRLGQGYVYQTGSPTFSTQISVEHGFINVNNGDVHLEFPIANPPQAGSILSSNARLVYDSRIWKIVDNNGDYSWQPTNSGPMGGWTILTGGETGKDITYEKMVIQQPIPDVPTTREGTPLAKTHR